MTLIYIFIGISILFFIVLAAMYNGLISKRNNVEFAFGSIDVMLKKRHDLIPNLVSTVKGYMTHEQNLLTQITALRNEAMQAKASENDRFQTEGKLSAMLGKIQIAVESYPNLKANTNFLQLQATLNEVEEQLSAARRAYNASIKTYNDAVEMIPTNIMAQMMGLERRASFEITEAESRNVNVAEHLN
ncbi:MAG: LemA family protein [Chitinophagales bacterium]